MYGSKTHDIAQAATIALLNVRPELLKYGPNPAKIKEILGPADGFLRDRPLIIAAGSAPINDFAHVLKGAKYPMGQLRN